MVPITEDFKKVDHIFNMSFSFIRTNETLVFEMVLVSR